jgi:hypothetical protein
MFFFFASKNSLSWLLQVVLLNIVTRKSSLGEHAAIVLDPLSGIFWTSMMHFIILTKSFRVKVLWAHGGAHILSTPTPTTNPLTHMCDWTYLQLCWSLVLTPWSQWFIFLPLLHASRNSSATWVWRPNFVNRLRFEDQYDFPLIIQKSVAEFLSNRFIILFWEL